MNQSSYFNNIADIGSLYLDYVFNYFENEPIIFTCISEYGKIYLCLCSEIRKEQKWIVSPCYISIIEKLVNKKIDIFHALINSNKVILVVLAPDGSERSEWIDVNEINEFDLPEKNVFLKCYSEKANAYLKELNTLFRKTEITIFDIAKYILKKCGEMSTLKLQKICYYMQAWYMVLLDKPLFKEDFEAWSNGPVCPQLFYVHKGMYNITESKLPYGNDDILNIYEINFLNYFINIYASMSSEELKELSHSEKPWQSARKNLEINSPSHNIISKESIKEYYEKIQLPLF